MVLTSADIKAINPRPRPPSPPTICRHPGCNHRGNILNAKGYWCVQHSGVKGLTLIDAPAFRVTYDHQVGNE